MMILLVMLGNQAWAAGPLKDPFARLAEEELGHEVSALDLALVHHEALFLESVELRLDFPRGGTGGAAGRFGQGGRSL